MEKHTVPGIGGREFVVTDEAGNILKAGDQVHNFRGVPAVLERIAAVPMPGSSAKVTTSLGTHYDTVYKLTVRIASDRGEHDCTADCYTHMRDNGIPDGCDVDEAWAAYTTTI